MNLYLIEGYIFKILFIKYASIVLERGTGTSCMTMSILDYNRVDLHLPTFHWKYPFIPNSLSDLDVTLFAFIIYGFHEEFFEGLLNV